MRCGTRAPCCHGRTPRPTPHLPARHATPACLPRHTCLLATPHLPAFHAIPACLPHHTYLLAGGRASCHMPHHCLHFRPVAPTRRRCVDQMTQVFHPVIFVKFSTFRSQGKLLAHEALLAANHLHHCHTHAELQTFIQGNATAFFSHRAREYGKLVCKACMTRQARNTSMASVTSVVSAIFWRQVGT